MTATAWRTLRIERKAVLRPPTPRLCLCYFFLFSKGLSSRLGTKHDPKPSESVGISYRISARHPSRSITKNAFVGIGEKIACESPLHRQLSLQAPTYDPGYRCKAQPLDVAETCRPVSSLFIPATPSNPAIQILQIELHLCSCNSDAGRVSCSA
ncbi:uncharacterized protein BO80DRAFT_197558 [Aspergillus ibericus CBS 121593]|uniref:Uncharacterized protein n=1 Tax=Aspergillus ibericus CBS 121593 TaxID=1448316 RepID=A0A395GP34_9EURO|nr:hypothetical protein BO80DRAFT_197558 [Aspergillus ibericus CBS 121593]RAK97096.1 hypothetical protein BO80DRAFT_197558 [Aspergillus ibericus CBS 121593]